MLLSEPDDRARNFSKIFQLPSLAHSLSWFKSHCPTPSPCYLFTFAHPTIGVLAKVDVQEQRPQETIDDIPATCPLGDCDGSNVPH